jgi:hypothetical protein
LDFDNYSVGDRPSEFTGSYREPRVIDPSATDSLNPNTLPASPQGGNAMMVYDWAGGGNVAVSNFVYEGNAGYDLYVYINPDTNALTAGQVET